jgi:hypothetical protein
MVSVHIRHTPEAVEGCGSFEVYYSDGRQSVFFYYEDVASRRLRPEQVNSVKALEQAREFARSERERLR